MRAVRRLQRRDADARWEPQVWLDRAAGYRHRHESTPVRAVAVNLAAEFRPATFDVVQPSIVVAGVWVFAYINPDGVLQVSVHLDETEPWLLSRASTVRCASPSRAPTSSPPTPDHQPRPSHSARRHDMTEPRHHGESAPVTAPADSGEPVIVYDPVAARQWLLDGAADEHGIDEDFTTTELTIVARLEDLLAALGYGAVTSVWTTRLPLTNVLIWRTADGDGVDGGGLITADLTINGQPVRLASRHQGFDSFTRHSDTSGIGAAVEALGHVADLVNTEADLLRRALTPPGVYTVLGVWQDDKAIPVGVIAGQHEVTGGDDSEYEQGLWAISVAALDVDTAERLAIEEMQAD